MPGIAQNLTSPYYSKKLQETHAFISNLTTHADLMFPLQLPRRAR